VISLSLLRGIVREQSAHDIVADIAAAAWKHGEAAQGLMISALAPGWAARGVNQLHIAD